MIDFKTLLSHLESRVALLGSDLEVVYSNRGADAAPVEPLSELALLAGNAFATGEDFPPIPVRGVFPGEEKECDMLLSGKLVDFDGRTLLMLTGSNGKISFDSWAPGPLPAGGDTAHDADTTLSDEICDAPDAPEEEEARLMVRTAQSASCPTVLVAEDNENNYLLYATILEESFNLVRAIDGCEAVDLFGEVNPDLVLMDINMPRMDGYEATRIIRGLSQTVPVIAVTAYAFEHDASRMRENGFDSFLSKPIDASRLLSEIERCLAKGA